MCIYLTHCLKAILYFLSMSEKLEKLIAKLKAKNLTIAFAESMSSGRIMNEFSKCPGAGDVLLGGLVTYKPELKVNLLDVRESTLKKYTAESRQVTSEMAIGLKKLIKADMCTAITGLAAPGGSETREKPVGTVFISILFNDMLYEFREYFEPDQSKDPRENTEEIMLKTVDSVSKKICGLQL